MRSLMLCGMLGLYRRLGVDVVNMGCLGKKKYSSNASLIVCCTCQSCQFGRSMTGGFGDVAMAQFWDHCSQQEEWKDHPCLKDPSILRSRVQAASSINTCFFKAQTLKQIWKECRRKNETPNITRKNFVMCCKACFLFACTLTGLNSTPTAR